MDLLGLAVRVSVSFIFKFSLRGGGGNVREKYLHGFVAGAR